MQKSMEKQGKIGKAIKELNRPNDLCKIARYEKYKISLFEARS